MSSTEIQAGVCSFLVSGMKECRSTGDLDRSSNKNITHLRMASICGEWSLSHMMTITIVFNETSFEKSGSENVDLDTILNDKQDIIKLCV